MSRGDIRSPGSQHLLGRLIRWDEIQAFTLLSSGGSSPVKAHLRGGPPHPIMGLRAGKADEKRITDLVADLNRELERRTGRTIDPSWHDRKSVRAREATSQPQLSPRMITLLLVLIGLVAAPFGYALIAEDLTRERVRSSCPGSSSVHRPSPGCVSEAPAGPERSDSRIFRPRGARWSASRSSTRFKARSGNVRTPAGAAATRSGPEGVAPGFRISADRVIPVSRPIQ